MNISFLITALLPAILTAQNLILPEKLLKFRKIADINNVSLAHDLQIMANSAMDIDDVNQLVQFYNVSLTSILEKHAPLKTKTITIRPRLPWYTNDLKELKLQRRRAERRWRKTNDLSDFQVFRSLRNLYSQKLQQSKFIHINDMVSECGRDSKKLFKLVNNLTGRAKVNQFPDENADVLASKFCDFFSQKIEDIRKELAQHEVYKPTLTYCGKAFDQFVKFQRTISVK